MKKIMMILAVLFVMVGSSLGNWYNGGSTTDEVWNSANSATIAGYYTQTNENDPNENPWIVFRATTGEFYMYNKSTSIDAEYKLVLSQVISALNSKAKVNILSTELHRGCRVITTMVIMN